MGESIKPSAKNDDDWILNGMEVDKAGNVIHNVGRTTYSGGKEKTVSSFAYIGEIQQGLQVVNLSKKKLF